MGKDRNEGEHAYRPGPHCESSGNLKKGTLFTSGGTESKRRWEPHIELLNTVAA